MEDMAASWILVSILVGAFIAAGIYAHIKQQYIIEIQNNLSNIKPYITFDGYSYEKAKFSGSISTRAKLFSRNAAISKVLMVNPIQRKFYTNHPAEVTYTQATVGVATSGKFHVHEAYCGESLSGDSGKAEILVISGEMYRYSKYYTRLDSITLTSDELIKSAKENPVISKFLVGDTLYLHYSGKDTLLDDFEKRELEIARQNSDKAKELNTKQRSFLAQQLTPYDCNAVISWLCGN